MRMKNRTKLPGRVRRLFLMFKMTFFDQAALTAYFGANWYFRHFRRLPRLAQ